MWNTPANNPLKKWLRPAGALTEMFAPKRILKRNWKDGTGNSASEWRVYEQKLAWDMVWNGRDKIVEAREIMGTPDNIIVKKSLFWDT